MIGEVLSGIPLLRDAVAFYKTRLTSLASYDDVGRVHTGIDHEYVEGILGIPALTYAIPDSRGRIVYYRRRGHLIQLVYGSDDKVEMFSVTAMARRFLVPFQVAGVRHRLGRSTFADFGESIIMYAEASSKDARYGEAQYLANPGDYQYLLLSSHYPPGTDWGDEGAAHALVSVCHKLQRQERTCGVEIEDREVADMRKRAMPNTFGFVRGDLAAAVRHRFGAIYAEVRPLLRRN